MAHTCPICQTYCTCAGDIDDMDLGIVPKVCFCCIDKEDEDDDDFDYGDCDDDIEERNDPNDSRNL